MTSLPSARDIILTWFAVLVFVVLLVRAVVAAIHDWDQPYDEFGNRFDGRK
jgi:hypothetical protein